MPMRATLSPTEAAARLGISTRTLARLRAEGRIKFIPDAGGRCRAYDPAELDRFIRSSSVRAPRKAAS